MANNPRMVDGGFQPVHPLDRAAGTAFFGKFLACQDALALFGVSRPGPELCRLRKLIREYISPRAAGNYAGNLSAWL